MKENSNQEIKQMLLNSSISGFCTGVVVGLLTGNWTGFVAGALVGKVGYDMVKSASIINRERKQASVSKPYI